jgi:hypothetical protein
VSLPAQILLYVVIFIAGMGAGVKVHQGIVARAELAKQEQLAREKHRQREFADGQAQSHAHTIESLSTELLEAHATIADLEARSCLDPGTVRVLNRTGNLPARTPAREPADPGPAAQAAGGDAPAADAGPALKAASNIDVAAYIAYCRTEYGKIADRLNRVLDIEDRRFPPTTPRTP